MNLNVTGISTLSYTQQNELTLLFRRISEEISSKNPFVNTSHMAIRRQARRLTCGWCSQRYPHRVPGGLGTFLVKGLLIVTAEEMTGSWGAY